LPLPFNTGILEFWVKFGLPLKYSAEDINIVEKNPIYFKIWKKFDLPLDV